MGKKNNYYVMVSLSSLSLTQRIAIVFETIKAVIFGREVKWPKVKYIEVGLTK